MTTPDHAPMHLVFLPGAGGSAEFWRPLGALLPAAWKKTYLFWPGLGNEPHAPTVKGFDDLVRLAEQELHGPTVVVAQSMGGIVGVRLALKRPESITHLVLAATSGGVDVAGLGGEDWRASYLGSFPEAATWIVSEKPDHTGDIRALRCPTLLLWGERDPISPPAVGQYLSSLIRQAKLHVIAGGSHDLGREKARDIFPLILDHVAGSNDHGRQDFSRCLTNPAERYDHTHANRYRKKLCAGLHRPHHRAARRLLPPACRLRRVL